MSGVTGRTTWQCLWCGDPIPGDRPDDDFCSDGCHWQYAEDAGADA